MTFIFFLIFAYLLGSVPFGIFFGMGLDGKDPRHFGSRNIGMTNVWRSSGASAGLLTLLCDALKASLVICLCPTAWSDHQLAWIGFAVAFGHCYSAYLNFSGGKGVATAAGVLLVLSPSLFALSLTVWISLRLLTGTSSQASLAAVGIICLSSFWLWPTSLWPLFTLLGMIVFRHRSNIERLRTGHELQA